MPKIQRDSFLYLEPKGNGAEFAQCGVCAQFNPAIERCKALRPNDRVTAEMSCGYFAEGETTKDKPQSWFTPEEVGLVDRQVRCMNCISFDGKGKCNLYAKLNKAFPEIFDLDERVKPHACCNAQEPKQAKGREDESRGAAHRALERARKAAAR